MTTLLKAAYAIGIMLYIGLIVLCVVHINRANGALLDTPCKVTLTTVTAAGKRSSACIVNARWKKSQVLIYTKTLPTNS